MSSSRRTSDAVGDELIDASSQVLSSEQVARAWRRVAHEICERHPDTESLILLGLQRGGCPFAEELSHLLEGISTFRPLLGTLDVSFYRDDLAERPVVEPSGTMLPVDIDGHVVILVDDVLFTGRTIRAALNALAEWGRPSAIELAVMVDRGHRELPIRADFVGKNLPTSRSELITATREGVWLGGGRA